jgi:Holliday junction DNA helicase RuvA
MIAALEGTVSEMLLDTVIIDVSGVGYGVYVTNEDYGVLKVGAKTRLCIYEHVREQSHDLFGFIRRETQGLFEMLLNVNGVGPKMALNLLSIGSVEVVKQAISEGDVAFIQRANGVGKRVAERVVVELKDKVGVGSLDLESNGLLKAAHLNNTDEAMEALLVLGYTAVDAVQALKGIDTNLPTEERVKSALKGIR